MATILETIARDETVAAVANVASLLHALNDGASELPIEYNRLMLRDDRHCYPIVFNFPASVAHCANILDIAGVAEIVSNAGGCCTVWLDVEAIHQANISAALSSWDEIEARLMA